MDIIQHHDKIDFEEFFSAPNGTINLDMNDFGLFMEADGEKHSFVGTGDGDSRVAEALEKATAGTGAEEMYDRVTHIMLVLLRSPEAANPLKMQEVAALNDFMSRFPSDVDVMWGVENDSTLGDSVKVVILLNVAQ